MGHRGVATVGPSPDGTALTNGSRTLRSVGVLCAWLPLILGLESETGPEELAIYMGKL